MPNDIDTQEIDRGWFIEKTTRYRDDSPFVNLKGWRPVTEMALKDHLVVVTDANHSEYYFVASNELIKAQMRYTKIKITDDNLVSPTALELEARINLARFSQYHYVV
jgi:hypothetical protein